MKLPDCPFYLFGMGHRRKLLYRAGLLSDALTGELLRRWDVTAENIVPSEYTVELVTAGGQRIVLSEDEAGVWVDEGDARCCAAEGALKLPRFEGHQQAALLRTLHHEVLINVVDGRPVPNLFVYTKPWRRDAAMACMVLQRTGNLRVVEDWIMGLSEPFDRNNSGYCEPDNLGQNLYMVSLVADASHPLVHAVLSAAEPFQRDRHVVGLTDFAEHPVFQTKWLKYGLSRLGLEDGYEIPEVYDQYSALFWMDYRDAHAEGPPFDKSAKTLYPYLGWAEAHFHGWQADLTFAQRRYPITWEAEASQANYAAMARVHPDYVERRLCAPHSWHAAEMFLYLVDEGTRAA